MPPVSPPPVPATTKTDDTWYSIEKLLNHKKVGKKDFYLVKWQDANGSQSWEPAENITQYAIDQYFIEKRAKAKRRKKRRV